MLILSRLERGGGSERRIIAPRRRGRLAAVGLLSTAPRNPPPKERTRPPEFAQLQALHLARLLEADGRLRVPKNRHLAPKPAFRLEPLLQERQVPRLAFLPSPEPLALRPASLRALELLALQPASLRALELLALQPASLQLQAPPALRPASLRPPGPEPLRAPPLAKVPGCRTCCAGRR